MFTYGVFEMCNLWHRSRAIRTQNNDTINYERAAGVNKHSFYPFQTLQCLLSQYFMNENVIYTSITHAVRTVGVETVFA